MAQKIRNNGVMGLIDVTTDGTVNTALSFNANIFTHGAGVQRRAISRRGRGSAGVPKFRLGDYTGSGTAAGLVQSVKRPIPAGTKYATGTLTIQEDTGCSIAYPIRITAISTQYNAKKAEIWGISFTWVLAGNPVVTWADTTVTFTAPATNDQETYAGMTKKYDANGLMNGATQRIDCETITDTDAAEVTKMVALLATSTPMTNLKILTLSCSKEDDDSEGLVVTIEWALQDSKDNVETPKNTVTTDPWDLESAKTFAIVYNIGTPPSTPALPSGLKLRPYVDQKLNDQKAVRIFTWAKRDTKDDRELPERVTSIDPSGLESQASDALLDGTPATPSGFVARAETTTYTTTDHTVGIVKAGLRSTEEDQTFPGTFVATDPSDLETKARQTLIFDNTGSTPGATVPTGTVLRETTITKETGDSTTHKSKVVYEFGKRTTQEDVEFPGTFSEVDPFDLTNNGKQTIVFNTGSSPPAATVPTHTKEIGHAIFQLTSAGTGHSYIVYKFEPQSSIDKIEQNESFTAVDPSGLESRAKVTLVDATPTAPSGFVNRLTTTQDLSDWHSKTEVQAGLRSTAEDITFPGTFVVTDPSDLETRAKQTLLFDNTGTIPTPSAPSGTVLRESTIIKETADATTHQSRLSADFGKRTTEEDVTFPGTHTDVDPADLRTTGQKVVVFNTGSTPTPPTPPTHTKIVGSWEIQLTSAGTAKSSKTWHFAPQTSQDEIEQGGTWTYTDPSGIESRGFGVKVDGTPTTPAGFIVRGTKTQALNDWHSQTTIDLGLQTVEQEIENRGTNSTRSAREPWTRTLRSVYASTSDDAALAAAEWAANQNLADIYKIVVAKLNPGVAQVDYHFVNPGILVISQLFGEKRMVEARLDPTDATKVQVYVCEAITAGGGRCYVKLGRAMVQKQIRMIQVIRQMAANSTAPFVPDNQSQTDNTNNAPFLGLPAGTVRYTGAQSSVNISLSYPFKIGMAYQCLYDSLGIFDLFGFRAAPDYYILSMSAPALGWTDITTLTGSGLTAIPATQSDLSFITT